jgi:acyl-coenzyme A synthetase/AMP-(fatty) acid ligase
MNLILYFFSLLERVAHYKQLKGGVEFVKEIPKSAAGKILRRVLKDQEAAKRSENKENEKVKAKL